MTDQQRRERARAFWHAVDSAPTAQMAAVCRAHLSPHVLLRGPAPVGDLTGPDAVAEGWFEPLRRALPEWRRETHIALAGSSSGRADAGADGRAWACGTGYLHGSAATDCFGIPRTDVPLRLRWADFLRFDGDEILEVQTLIDIVDWCAQIGKPMLPPSRGVPFVYPAPTGVDGVLHTPQNDVETSRTLALGRGLLFDGLNAFDRSDLASMGMAAFFHPNIKWYGPGGIGACLSLQEFQELHQRPWLIAFPDRRVQDLDALFAEGPLLASTGWSAVKAVHSGPYLGTPASHRPVTINGIDFWLRAGERFVENWVFVDMVDLFSQFGEDLFDRMRRA